MGLQCLHTDRQSRVIKFEHTSLYRFSFLVSHLRFFFQIREPKDKLGQTKKKTTGKRINFLFVFFLTLIFALQGKKKNFHPLMLVKENLADIKGWLASFHHCDTTTIS